MDAHAHLLSLGWAGPGHSLDSRPQLQHKGRRGIAYDPSQNTNNGRGLVKPLLISQKKNTFGIGKKIHEPAAGNEWWLKGFENALRGIGKNSDSEATSGTATPDDGNLPAYRGKHAGLYGFFVKGQQMKGTIGEQRLEGPRGQKRKSDTFDDDEDLSTSSGQATPNGSSTQPNPKVAGKAAADFEQVSQFMGMRDKDRKRAERIAKVDAAQEFDRVGRFFEARSDTKRKKKRVGEKEQDDHFDAHVETEKTAMSKEERRLARKKSKIEKASKADDLSEKEKVRKTKETNVDADQSPLEDPTAADEAVRKAERKRRKEEKRLAKQQTAS